MKITIQTTSTSHKGHLNRPDCLISLVPQKGTAQISPARLNTFLKTLMSEKIFKGKKSSALFVPGGGGLSRAKHLILLGLGDPAKVTAESLRQAIALGVRLMEKHSQTTAELDFSTLLPYIKDPQAAAQALSEGFILAEYRFDKLKKKNKEHKAVKEIILKNIPSPGLVKKGLLEGRVIAQSANFARQLADHPSNLMTPALLAEEVQKQAQSINGLKVTVWNKARLSKEKMGGILGVSSGSAQEPRLIMMEYKGSGAKKPLCFVGKGLTFDSGGISLKPPKDMDEMKFDMCGGTAVIGALFAIARLKLNVSVIGLVGASENMPGAGAVKPGDILTARNGKTMEVLNTDAEGRLVLADVLSYACEQKPEWIVDAATLTGAIVVALSNIYTGVFTRNPDLKQKLLKAAEQAGEKMWPMPLDDFHVKDIKSQVGDVANISCGAGGGSSTAAAFLEHFVDKKIPWAHLDIAGTAYNTAGRLPYCRPKSASGVMVRTFVELSRQHES